MDTTQYTSLILENLLNCFGFYDKNVNLYQPDIRGQFFKNIKLPWSQMKIATGFIGETPQTTFLPWGLVIEVTNNGVNISSLKGSETLVWWLWIRLQVDQGSNVLSINIYQVYISKPWSLLKLLGSNRQVTSLQREIWTLTLATKQYWTFSSSY